MKISLIAIFAVAAAVTVASPHPHRHHHAHGITKHEARPNKIVYAPFAIETVIKYVLDGHDISAEEARLGLANGTLEWGSDGVLSTSTTAPKAIATMAPSLVPAPSPPSLLQSEHHHHHQTAEQSSQSVEKPTQPTEQPAAEATPKLPQSNSAPEVDTSLRTAAQLVDSNGYCASCDIQFPNDKIPCTKFPYGYGAMPIDHEGLGGWSGIQDPSYRGADGYDDIRTVVSGSCKDGSCCTPGTWCSYGCPNPYLKLSFPKKQGRTGQSVGGLYCNEKGMLEMADGSIGKTMCGPGASNMTVKVHNRLAKPVSICRTDYPGTESMTFPLTVGPGETGYLANPSQSKYFFWRGEATSAHYYVNNQGVSEADGCTWSEPSEARGNWAPTIFGTSWDDRNMNMGFSSLKQNELNKAALLDYSITFTGDGVNAACSYKKSSHQYCEGDKCWCVKDEPDRGCTASTNPGGTLTLILHDD